jgi:hypothetical protein
LCRPRKALFESIGTRISLTDRSMSEATATSGLLAHTARVFTMQAFELGFRPLLTTTSVLRVSVQSVSDLLSLHPRF